MAALHVGKRWVISLDLENFFGRVHVKHIVPMLVANGIEAKPARLIAELCTYKFFLPQGGITSPKLSNLVTASTFGPVLQEYCKKNELTLTVYADDITVSTDKDLSVEQLKDVTRKISQIVSSNGGFKVKGVKTKWMSSKVRQTVCGVIVNEKTNLVEQERNRLRAIVRNISINGFRAEAAKSEMEAAHFAKVIKGRLGWYSQLNKRRAEKLMVSFQESLAKYAEELAEEA